MICVMGEEATELPNTSAFPNGNSGTRGRYMGKYGNTGTDYGIPLTAAVPRRMSCDYRPLLFASPATGNFSR
jgi:hypothetical protein